MKEFLAEYKLLESNLPERVPGQSFYEWLAENFYLMSDKSLEEFLDFAYCTEDAYDYSKYLITKKIKALLKRMQALQYNRICKVKSQAYDLFGYISLLFGLCASQSTFIFHSFFGSSLSRIPSSL